MISDKIISVYMSFYNFSLRKLLTPLRLCIIYKLFYVFITRLTIIIS